MSNSTLQIKLRHHALDQCEVLVSGKRVAYVCYGDEMPINYLPKKTIGLQLTIDEKIAIAK